MTRDLLRILTTVVVHHTVVLNLGTKPGVAFFKHHGNPFEETTGVVVNHEKHIDEGVID